MQNSLVFDIYKLKLPVHECLKLNWVKRHSRPKGVEVWICTDSDCKRMITGGVKPCSFIVDEICLKPSTLHSQSPYIILLSI